MKRLHVPARKAVGEMTPTQFKRLLGDAVCDMEAKRAQDVLKMRLQRAQIELASQMVRFFGFCEKAPADAFGAHKFTGQFNLRVEERTGGHSSEPVAPTGSACIYCGCDVDECSTLRGLTT